MLINDLEILIYVSGGKKSHFELFKYLLTNTFSDNYKDYRIGNSLISLFTPNYHPFLALAFWQEEYKLFQNFKNQIKTNQFLNPWQVLTLHNSITQFPYGDFLIKFLNNNTPVKLIELQKLMQINYSGDFGDLDLDYQQKLNQIIPNSELKTFLYESIENNNKVKTVYNLGFWLNYSEYNIIKITNFFEKWLLEN